MNLQNLKNTYAQEQGYDDWEDLQDDTLSDGEEMESHMDKICILAQKAAKAGRRVDFATECTCGQVKLNFGIDKATITNPENLIR